MNQLISDSDILEHLHAGRPIIDVRAPVEFAQGSVEASENIPLLDDNQRAVVGTAYKQYGADRAMALGYELISGGVLDDRMSAWTAFAERNPNAAVMCFRGGLRSQLVQAALAARGYQLPLITGGFKRVRNLLSSRLIEASESKKWMILSGYTGAGKTEVLRRSKSQFLDLEKSARHRGSVFGNQPTAQPSPIGFENDLGLTASKILAASLSSPKLASTPVWIEDESRSIGRLVLPAPLVTILSSANVWVLERPRQERAKRLVAEYLSENYGFIDEQTAEEEVVETARLDIGRAIVKIEKRLGGLEAKLMLEMTDSATREFARTGHFSAHWSWVERLLEKYYDPAYEYHIAKISSRVIGRGPEEAFRTLVDKQIDRF